MTCNFSVTNGTHKVWEMRHVPCFEDAWKMNASALYPMF